MERFLFISIRLVFYVIVLSIFYFGSRDEVRGLILKNRVLKTFLIIKVIVLKTFFFSRPNTENKYLKFSNLVLILFD